MWLRNYQLGKFGTYYYGTSVHFTLLENSGTVLGPSCGRHGPRETTEILGFRMKYARPEVSASSRENLQIYWKV